MKHVIIGVGAAGISAATAIRKRKPEDEIVMISKDEFVHSRCMLHKYLSHERNVETLNFIPDNFFSNNNIEWLKGTPVENVDTDNKTLRLPSGEMSYDTLLIATGAETIIPPLDGLSTARNVYKFRNLEDVQAIDKKIDAMENIVIIGSGLVGLDAASALLGRGKSVIMVEMSERILGFQLDAWGAYAYQKRFEKHGCKFRLERKVVETILDQVGDIKQLILSDGEILPCDTLILAPGMKPAVDFLKNSKLKCRHAIIVDRRLKTRFQDVYAAGDVTGLSGMWPNAVRQGEIAGKNMCGVFTQYTDVLADKNTINFYSLLSVSVGAIIPEEEDEVFIREDKENYQKVILRNGCVIGVILQGDVSNSGFWQYLIKNRIQISKIDKPVWKLSFADFYGVKENGEYEWVI